MLEALIQDNPNDCHSLETLKEVYWKLGNQGRALEVMRRLADAHLNQGRYEAALLEYEALQLQTPADAALQALITELKHTPAPSPTQDYALEITAEELASAPRFSDNGNSALAQLLLDAKLAPEGVVTAALDATSKANTNLGENTLATSLLEQTAKYGDMQLLLSGVLDKLKCPYAPLECYDIDWQIIKMLPKNLSLGRLIVPFDVVSRTLMVAMANPVDSEGKKAVQELLDYEIQWHLASPIAIAKVLRSTYHLEVT